MSWQWSLCSLGIGYVVISLAVRAFMKWHSKRYLRIPYSRLNAEKITPRFNVGSALK